MQTDRLQRGMVVALTLSGAAALIYETVWAKILGYYMGGTTPTVALILAAFMGGMAIGSWIADRWADRSRNPLALYGGLEIALAAFGATVPWAIPALGSVYLDLARHLGAASPALFVLRLSLFMALLTVPAFIMGATFPLACRGMVADETRMAQRVSALYAANSLGAVIGCIVCGFALIPVLGLSATSLAGTALNVASGVLGLALSRASGRGPRTAEARREPPEDRPGLVPDGRARLTSPPGSPAAPVLSRGTFEPGRPLLRTGPPGPPRAVPDGPALEPGDGIGEDDPFVAALPFHLLVSGFTAMAYEVAFTRLLPLVIGASTYSFTLMLAAFIAGITRGARVLSSLTEVDARRILSHCQLRLGLTILIGLPLFSLLPFAYVIIKCGMAPPVVLFWGLVFLLVVPIMAYPAYHLGMVIPAASVVFTRKAAGLGRGIGRAYAANTVGNVAGSLACGLLLIPGLGLHVTFVLMALFNLGSGLALGRFLDAGVPLRFRLGIAGGLGLALLFPAWHPALVAGGSFRINDRNLKTAFDLVASQGELPVLFMADDVNTTVMVQQTTRLVPPVRLLRVSGKVDASDSGDMHTQLLLAHLPLLLHPAPRNVLVIGIGSGVTAGAALTHPIDRLEAVEISQGVVAASTLFGHVNERYWEDSRARVIVDDARHYLQLTPLSYDVIISEPSNPWMAGIVNLYTGEFFRIAASRMPADGLFCQWIHIYEMDRESLAMVMRTFQSVFPEVRGFVTGVAFDLLLIGSRRPIAPTLGAMAARLALPRTGGSLRRMGVTFPMTLLLLEVFDPAEAREFAGAGVLVTDDQPLLEYTAPRAFYAGSRVDLPLDRLLDRTGRIWRRSRPDGQLGADELTEAIGYSRIVFPGPARRSLLERLEKLGTLTRPLAGELRELRSVR
ncbi:MAG: fused MFS/spermidine synthase [Candidatus Riflebacteria bacterium]|nr:fused MFS/spermidine synthase [Candidatus Riflebacteria bacterium]